MYNSLQKRIMFANCNLRLLSKLCREQNIVRRGFEELTQIILAPAVKPTKVRADTFLVFRTLKVIGTLLRYS